MYLPQEKAITLLFSLATLFRFWVFKSDRDFLCFFFLIRIWKRNQGSNYFIICIIPLWGWGLRNIINQSYVQSILKAVLRLQDNNISSVLKIFQLNLWHKHKCHTSVTFLPSHVLAILSTSFVCLVQIRKGRAHGKDCGNGWEVQAIVMHNTHSVTACVTQGFAGCQN